MRVLLTGVCGFIGSHLLRIMKQRGYDVVATARHTSSKNNQRIADIDVDVHWADLTNRSQVTGLCEGVDAVIHAAAMTFVDHSIRDPEPFIRNNVDSTVNLLEEARTQKVKRFLYCSTDETYGPILEGQHTEGSPMNPSNPYAASKVAAEMFTRSYFRTYGMETLISRSENVYGPFQGRKVIPVFVKKALNNESLPVYGDGQHRRQWLHVEDNCSGLLHILEHGTPGEIYNIASEQELTNTELAQMILQLMGKPEDMIKFIDDRDIRPGHDKRYAINADKLRALGWAPDWTLEDGFADAVKWYVDHPAWSK